MVQPDFLKNKGWVVNLPSWYTALVLALGFCVVTLQVVLVRAVRTSKNQPGEPVQLGQPVLMPTVEMLEHGRRTRVAKQESLIASWRTMVTEVHAKKQTNKSRSVRGLLEEHAAFPSITQHWNEFEKSLIWGENPPDIEIQTTLPRELHVVMDVANRLEAQWGLRP